MAADDLARGLRKLIPDEPDRTRLPPPVARSAIASSIGVGQPADDSGAGIASPVTESARALGVVKTLTSPDGLFTLEYRDPTQIDMTDANGRSVSFLYAEG